MNVGYGRIAGIRRPASRLAPPGVRLRSGLVLLAICTVTGVLGLFRIGSKGLWHDEAFSEAMARLDLPSLWSATVPREAFSGLYFVLLHLWLRLVRRGCACLPQSAEYWRRGYCSSSPDGYLTSALPPLRGCCSRATPSSSATNKRLVLTRLRCWQFYLPHMPLSGRWISHLVRTGSPIQQPVPSRSTHTFSPLL